MSIKTFKPTTPSRRHMTVSGFDGIDKHAKPEASLTEVLKKNAGRNSYGRITVRHRGGGEKRKYRIIDFKRDKVDMEATVLRLEYDPNRSANIALVQYEDGEKRYIIAPVGLAAGDKVISSAAADIKPGNCLPIANIPVGTVIHNVELQPGHGAAHGVHAEHQDGEAQEDRAGVLLLVVLGRHGEDHTDEGQDRGKRSGLEQLDEEVPAVQTRQAQDPGRDGGADVGPHDNADGLAQGEQAGVYKAHHHDRGGGRTLDDCRHAQARQKAQKLI